MDRRTEEGPPGQTQGALSEPGVKAGRGADQLSTHCVLSFGRDTLPLGSHSMSLFTKSSARGLEQGAG